MFFVSIKDNSGQRSVMAFGPFRTHGAALAQVDTVRRYVCEHFREGHWARFGTCRAKTAHAPGRFNNELDYAIDALP